MSTAIRFEHVSKKFILHHDRPRTFQELLIRLFRRAPSSTAEFWALHDVSFEIPWGQTVGFIGPNGSGKSTTLKLMAGILEPTSGTITVNGRLAALLELGAGFHPDLTGRENVYLNGTLLGFSQAEMRRRFDDIVAFAELEEFIDVPVKHYSSGMYVRLGFAVAVHVEPEILLVDEVLAVGDAAFQRKCLDRIYELKRQGVTIVFVSHDLGAVQSLCDYAYWFEHGRVQQEGNPVDVVMAYLSHSAQQEERAESRAPLEEARWGTGRIRITNVELCDETGTPCQAFPTGASMSVHIHYEAPEPVEDPVFGLAIHDQSGVHICGPNTDFGGLVIPRAEGSGCVVYHIPELLLLPGTYYLSVSVHNRPDTEMYDYHDRLYMFRVYPGNTRERYGLITLRGEWKQQERFPVEIASSVQEGSLYK